MLFGSLAGATDGRPFGDTFATRTPQNQSPTTMGRSSSLTKTSSLAACTSIVDSASRARSGSGATQLTRKGSTGQSRHVRR